MFRRILVPMDLTDRHEEVIDVATRLAKEATGEVVLMHVVESVEGLDAAEDEVFYQRLEARARERLEDVVRRLEAEDVRGRAEVRRGHRARTIVAYADESGADLLLMTSHPVEEHPGKGPTTLSYQVAILAACPVLLMK